jgi:hypothetical protein
MKNKLAYLCLLQKSAVFFLKIIENQQNRTGLNLKTTEFIVHCFKILEKNKNQQNICKKLIKF